MSNPRNGGGSHSHDANPEKLARKKVSEACKRKAQDNISERPTRIMRTVEGFQRTFNYRHSFGIRYSIHK